MMTVPTGYEYVWVKEHSSGNMISGIQHFDVNESVAPSVSIVSVESNAEPGLYETEKSL